MKKIVFLLFTAVFLSCGTDSNLIEGQVSNYEGDAVENVLVQVMGTDLNSTTDTDGYFRINTRNRGDELIFTHPKYKLKRVKISDQTEFSVELTEKSNPKPEQ